jgi:Bacterial regulatory proteins, tetR family
MTSLTSRQEKDPLGILSLPASRFRSGTQRIVARTLGRPMVRFGRPSGQSLATSSLEERSLARGRSDRNSIARAEDGPRKLNMKMKSHNLWALKTEANAPSGSTQAAPEAKAIQSRSGLRRTAERHQIVAGATAVLRSFGYDATSKDEIAKATGVSTNTLHAHFKSNKDKLLQTIAGEESAIQGRRVSKLNVPSRILLAN